jgi:hypothetical protein
MQDVWQHPRCTNCGIVVPAQMKGRKAIKYCGNCRQAQQKPYKDKAREKRESPRP